LPKRKNCTTMSSPSVAISAAQNHGPDQRGCAWSKRNSASAMVTAASGISEARV
jgi:hypothetical protein